MTGLFRPEALALLRRWSEPAAGAALGLAGLWIATRGGWLLPALGLPVAAVGAGWALLAWRRMRFARAVAAPGVVDVDEGRIRYLHPRMPGDVSLADLAEIRLLTLRGRSVWRLRDLSGATLLVPLDAAGAGGLFDAFASLPGLSSATLLAALAPTVPQSGPRPATPAPPAAALPAAAMQDRLVWRRAGQGLART